MSRELFQLKTKSITRTPICTWGEPTAAIGADFVCDVVNSDECEERSLLWRAQRGAELRGDFLSDWSSYTHFCFSVYADRSYGNRVQIRISTENKAGSRMAPYFRYQFPINFSGWKQFRVALADMGTNYDPDLRSVIGISLDCSGWEMTADPECKLWLGGLYVEKMERMIVPDPTSYGKAPFTEAKDNWRALIVGTESSNLSGSDCVKSIIASRDRACEEQLYSFRETIDLEKRDSLWGVEIVHGRAGDEYKVMALYSRFFAMVLAYGTAGGRYYRDPQLLEDCKTGLEYLYRYYYGPCMWEQGKYGNWWEWDIGIPMTLVKILLILEDELGEETVKRYLAPFDHLDYYPRMTAANKTWITHNCFASALLQNDAERILVSRNMFIDVFDYVNQGDGFYRDGSFIQHGRHPYAGGYALSMMVTLTDIMYAFHGTMFDITEGGVSNQYAWVFDTYLPIMHRGNLFANNRGREVCRKTSETGAGNSAIASMVKMIHYAPASVKARLEGLVKNHIATCGRDLSVVVPILFADYVDKLSVSAERTEYNVTKVFGKMDRVTHHNGRYAASVAMNSDRIWKYEAINLENMNAWYHGDGMIYLYANGFDYSYDFFHYVDPYRIPGVTCTDEPRVMENIRGGIFNGSPFAGGVSSGENGIAGVELLPSENEYFIPKLTARKSYFFMGEEIVALGSGITDGSDFNTYTVVENRNLKEGYRFTVNGAETALPEADAYTDGVEKVYYSGMGGYVFPTPVRLGMKKAEGEQDFIQLWLEHGVRPENASYAYAYLPNATEAEVAEYDMHADIDIISCTPRVHGVEKLSAGLEGYVFFEPDKLSCISASAPCAVMLKKTEDGVYVYVSDPARTGNTVSVELWMPEGVKVIACDGATAQFDGKLWRVEYSCKP